jgi:hypothetical protein
VATPEAECPCSRIGRGVQAFRIRGFRRKFRTLSELGPAWECELEFRAVLECRRCGRPFALVRAFYKDVEEILVAVPSPSWKFWDWAKISEISDSCRWRGSYFDERWVW